MSFQWNLQILILFPPLFTEPPAAFVRPCFHWHRPAVPPSPPDRTGLCQHGGQSLHPSRGNGKQNHRLSRSSASEWRVPKFWSRPRSGTTIGSTWTRAPGGRKRPTTQHIVPQLRGSEPAGTWVQLPGGATTTKWSGRSADVHGKRGRLARARAGSESAISNVPSLWGSVAAERGSRRSHNKSGLSAETVLTICNRSSCA